MLTSLSNNLCVTDLTNVPSGHLYENISAIMSGIFQLSMKSFHLNDAVKTPNHTSNDCDLQNKTVP